MQRNFGLGFVVGAAVGGAATCVILRARQPTRVDGRTADTTGYKSHPALKYGAPSRGIGTQNIKFFEGFVAAFDTQSRNPAWVLEHLIYRDKKEDNVDRSKSDFFEDKDIEERFRNRMSDFRGSGYDRGHLAPAASHNYSQKAMNETFTLSNISPQVGVGFNRHYWARLEKFVKDLVKVSNGVFVVTGPVWLPQKSKDGQWVMQYPMIGEAPSLVSVPTHFYKVILAEVNQENSNRAECAIGAFVLPNQRIDPNTPLTRFAVPINDLECATGTKFFPEYLTNERRAALDSAAIGWRAVGLALKKKQADDLPLLEPGKSTTEQIQQAQKTPSTTKSENNGLQKQQRSLPSPVTGRSGRGAIHLCEHTTCNVAAEDFWVKKKQPK